MLRERPQISEVLDARSTRIYAYLTRPYYRSLCCIPEMENSSIEVPGNLYLIIVHQNSLPEIEVTLGI
jgi:hypothetical protein